MQIQILEIVIIALIDVILINLVQTTTPLEEITTLAQTIIHLGGIIILVQTIIHPEEKIILVVQGIDKFLCPPDSVQKSSASRSRGVIINPQWNLNCSKPR